MRPGLRSRLLAPVFSFLLAIGIASPGHSIEMISGTLPFSSVGLGPTPFTAFGGLTVTSTDSIMFEVTYDETTADSNASANIGEYNAITAVSLTIGASTVNLTPGGTQSDFSTTESRIRINTLTDLLTIDIRSAPDLGTFEQQFFTINLRGLGGLLTIDSLDPLGGLLSPTLADFTGSNDATLGSGPFTALREVSYNVNGGTITFGSVTPPPPPPPTAAIPEPSTLSLLAFGLAGFAWMRRRRGLAG